MSWFLYQSLAIFAVSYITDITTEDLLSIFILLDAVGLAEAEWILGEDPISHQEILYNKVFFW